MARVVTLLAVMGLVVAGSATAATPHGTWRGRLVNREDGIPTSAFPTASVAVTAATVVATFHGLTMATHDAQNAVSTCSMTFRYKRTVAGWRFYTQAGRPRIVGTSTGGPPEFSPCSSSGPAGGAIRLRRAGATVKTEFNNFYRADDEWAVGLSGYLRR